jgi:CubicO group peptidase (beta-lactamase class C family)
MVEPAFPPDTVNTYSAMSFGWILGEVIRRTDAFHRPYERFLLEEVCEPLGIGDFHLGIGGEQVKRAATLTFPEEPPPHSPDSLAAKAQPYAIGSRAIIYNDPRMRCAVQPSGGGLANADSVARLFAMLAGRGLFNGVRILSEQAVVSCLKPRKDYESIDLTFNKKMDVGRGGLWISVPNIPRLARHGHTGTGGTFGWADLDLGISIAVTHNRMRTANEPLPFARIVDLVHDVAKSGRGL